MTEQLTFDGAQQMAEAMAARFVSEAQKAIAARGRFVVGLTGGSAAKTLYPTMLGSPCDWSRVHFFFGDERKVPPDHPECNFRAVRDAWLSKPQGVHIHAVHTELAAEAAAEEYASELAPFLPFDVVHLGMGPDGHVASLFPGHPLLDEKKLDVSWLGDSPKPPPVRITVTLPVLAQARQLWFLVQGAPKAEAVRAALKDPSSKLPAALAHRSAKQSVWFLDKPAAAQL
ncbi:MAG: 6-phosphogluconolactonase [Myxococcaceae bacterium]